MARTDNLTNFLTDVADSIREKKGTTEPILASNFDTEIGSIQSGGADFEIKDASYLFSYNGRLDIVNEIVSLISEECTQYNYMFNGCSALREAPTFVTTNALNFRGMFYSCGSMTVFPALETRTVTDFANMCSYAYGFKTIPLLNMDSATNVSNMFDNCSNLTTLGGFKNLGKAFTQKSANYSYYRMTLSTSSVLTHESLMNVINNLYDLNLTYNVANGGTLYTQQLVIGATNMAKLTEDEIAIATNKGWVVS